MVIFRKNFIIITKYRIISESNKRIVAIESCAVFAPRFCMWRFCPWVSFGTFLRLEYLCDVFAPSVSCITRRFLLNNWRNDLKFLQYVQNTHVRPHKSIKDIKVSFVHLYSTTNGRVPVTGFWTLCLNKVCDELKLWEYF